MQLRKPFPSAVWEFGKCAAVFFLSVILAVGSLTAASFAPQSRINENLITSAYGLYAEGQYPVIADRQINSLLDNNTDTTMLRACAGMNHHYLGSILTNPIYTYDVEVENEEDYPAKCLELYGLGEEPTNQWLYPRYWLGFRAIMRWLLVFFDYFQIRRYTGALFFLLFALVICSVSKHCSTKTAFAFAVSIILVRPQVITNSLQFSCCFLIAFPAMLLVPLLADRPRWDPVFFLEIGILTMFFDFYTVPLITAGFPLVYLAVLRSRQGRKITLRWLLRCVLIWLCGYAFMWLAKLLLTNALTSVDALGDGFSSFFRRVGIEKTEGLEQYYSVSPAFRKIGEVLFSDAEGKVVYLGTSALLVLLTGIQACRKKLRLCDVTAHAKLLAVALLPLIWFAVTAQPIAIHYWYQYRGIALTYWAVGAYVTQTFWQRAEREAIQTV